MYTLFDLILTGLFGVVVGWALPNIEQKGKE